MDKQLHDVTPGQQSRAFAAWYGVQVGLCWTASFGLFMWGLQQPFASNFSLLVGLASVPLAVWLLRGFRRDIAPLSLRRAWHMAWLLFLCAAMITTAAQYIYFAYLDGGLLARAYSELLTSPEYRPLLQQMLPGQDIDALATDMTAMLAQTTPSQLTMQLAFMNVLLATILAIPTALFSFKSEK